MTKRILLVCLLLFVFSQCTRITPTEVSPSFVSPGQMRSSPTVRTGLFPNCVPASGMLYRRDGQMIRIDNAGQESILPIDLSMPKVRAKLSPDSKILAFTTQTSMGEVSLKLACASGSSQGVPIASARDSMGFAWVNSQTLQYGWREGTPNPNGTAVVHINLVDIPSLSEEAATELSVYPRFQISPTNQNFALVDRENQFFVLDRGKGTKTDLWTFHQKDREINAQWSPRGEKIAFVDVFMSSGRVTGEIYLVNPDGSNLIKLTNFSQEPGTLPGRLTWSPDGEYLAYTLNRRGMGTELYVFSFNKGESRSLETQWVGGALPVWSPDSREIGFISNRIKNDQWDVYAISIITGNVRQVTNDPALEELQDWR